MAVFNREFHEPTRFPEDRDLPTMDLEPKAPETIPLRWFEIVAPLDSPAFTRQYVQAYRFDAGEHWVEFWGDRGVVAAFRAFRVAYVRELSERDARKLTEVRLAEGTD